MQALRAAGAKEAGATTTLFSPSLYGGRFTRSQFWKYGILSSILLAFLKAAAKAATKDSDIVVALLIPALIDALSLIFLFLPIYFKRAHDIGWSVVQDTQFGVITDRELDSCGWGRVR